MKRILALASLVAAPLLAQQQSGSPASNTSRDPKKPLTHADYAKWETLGAGSLSPDGKWVAYEVRRNSGSGELRYRAVAGGEEHRAPNGTGATFSKNSRWLLYTITPDTAGGGGRGG